MKQHHNNSRLLPLSLQTVAISMCAVLYAVGSYSTAYIPSPWGFGQFRPAVIIPAFFATIFGPAPAAFGAAIGTLIADSAKHASLYPGSLLAAVPGNFIGFYLFGYIVKKFSWRRFVLATNVTLTVANAIVAFLYVFLFKVLYLGDLNYVSMTPDLLILLSTGLTLWWFVTMLPFVLIFTPLLIRATSAAFPSIVSKEIRTHSLRQELPKITFSLAMLVPGLIMVAVGLATTYINLSGIPLGAQIMFYVSGITLSILGVLIHTGRSFLIKKPLFERIKNPN